MQGKWPLFVVKVSFPQSLAVAVGQFFPLYLAILHEERMNPVPYGNLCSLGSERAKFNLLRGSEICGDKNKATAGRARGATGHHFTLHGESAYTPRRIGLHSTEHRATLHGASGYTPRRIGLHSTERKTTPCREVFQPPLSSPSRNGFYSIGVHGKSRAPLLMRLLFGFPDEKQFKGACPKSRRDERPQTGV